nr:DUF4258 domain-containing protein [Candidatus Njordarchaeum guaymaensis]
MTDKETTVSKHAVMRMARLDVDYESVRTAICEGERVSEGKTKVRFRLRVKREVLLVICREFPDRMHVITVMKGKEKGR